MGIWEKLGLIFPIREYSNESWMTEFAQAPSVLIFDKFIRVYFSTRPVSKDGQYVSYSSYVDLDRFNLNTIRNIAEKPILKLGNPGTFDEFGTYPVSVIEHGNKLLCYYGGWTRCSSVPFNVAIGIAESHDGGITFDKLGEGPVLSYSPDEPFIISGPKIREFNGKLFLWYIAGERWIDVDGRPEPIYKIRMATSDNGVDWTKHNKSIISSKVKDEAQASPDVIYHDGKYHMFFSYRYGAHYRGKKFGYRIGYASSDNLFSWERNDDLAGIDISDEGWDAEMISYPHVFKLDNEIYMLYLGNQVGKEGFGLARLKNRRELS